MDARDKLRIYLEQRRDLGESELLLDSMTVEEALRTLGASGKSPGTAKTTLRAPALREPTPRELGAAVPATDWRSALGSPQPETAPAEPPDKPQLPDAPAGITVAGENDELFDTDIMRHGSLGTIAKAVQACTRCPLYKTATNGVPGEGDPKARLVCVGEAPGANEDETGRPFVGQAGGLLTKILAAVNLTREEVFITNVVKHRPPGNRNPAPNEIEACSPYLVRQLELIKPKVIVAFGTFAAQTLLNTKTPIGKLRGEVHRYHGIPLVVTYHPAALLRNPSWKRPTWEDVKLARRILDSSARS
ncbi:MAG: uracil-DNA glycosylase [Gemmatimonadaceae bacterium]